MANRENDLGFTVAPATVPSITLSTGKADGFKAIANTLGEVALLQSDKLDREARLEAAREGTVAGATGTPTLHEDETTIRGQAFNDAARHTYANRIDIAARHKIAELELIHKADPAGFKGAAKGYLAGMAQEIGAVDKAMAAVFAQTYEMRAASSFSKVQAGYNKKVVAEQRGSTVRLQETLTNEIDSIAENLVSTDINTATTALSNFEASHARLQIAMDQERPDGTPLFTPEDREKALVALEDDFMQGVGRAWSNVQADPVAALDAIRNGEAKVSVLVVDPDTGEAAQKEISITDALDADGEEKLIGYVNRQITAASKIESIRLKRTEEAVANLEIGIADGTKGMDDVIAADKAGLFKGRQKRRVSLTKAVLTRTEKLKGEVAGLSKELRDERIADLEISVDDETAGLAEILVAERSGLFAGNPSKRASIRKAWRTKEEARLVREEGLDDAAAAEDVSEQIADLEIAVNASEVDQDAIDAQDEKGLFRGNQQKRVQLTNKVRERQKEERKLAKSVARGAAGVAGSVTLNPKDSEDVKAVDNYYKDASARVDAAVEQEALDEAAAPVVLRTMAVNIVKKTGVVPKALQGELVGAMRAGTDEEKVQAADTIAQINDIPGNVLADEMGKRDIAMGVQISALVRAGQTAEQAVASVVASTDPANKPVIEARKANIKAEKWEDDYQAEVIDFFDPTGISDFFPFGQSNDAELTTLDGTLERATAEYKTLFEDWYARTGDKELATKQAEKDLGRVWAVTRVDGGVRVMKYAPEAYYGIGVDDGKWMKAQLRADVKDIAPDVDPEKIWLGSDSRTAREASNRAPTYPVLFIGESGAIEPLMSEGRSVRWNPDAKAAKQAVVKTAIKDAQDLRQRTIAADADLELEDIGLK